VTLDEYQTHARETAIYPPEHRITYPALGLAGETGETVERVKKWLRDGRLDRDGLRAEIGDVLWYVANLAADLDLSLDEIAGANLAKLRSRKERGVLSGSGDHR
jgi:NTP pyrophosphatase (non-canonical NTP hydrolase)